LAQAQQPFTTDDTDVTSRRKFNLQIGNEFDILPRPDYPALRQNVVRFLIARRLKDLSPAFRIAPEGGLTSFFPNLKDANLAALSQR
jgi:hypothetical protein